MTHKFEPKGVQPTPMATCLLPYMVAPSIVHTGPQVTSTNPIAMVDDGVK